MTTRSGLFVSPLVIAQLVFVASALAALILWPPATGKMLLVPIWPGAEQGMLARAVDSGATLVERGRIGRSFVVWGNRGALAPLLRHGVLLVAAPNIGCGTGNRRLS